jgi:hypothetical protein
MADGELGEEEKTGLKSVKNQGKWKSKGKKLVGLFSIISRLSPNKYLHFGYGGYP